MRRGEVWLADLNPVRGSEQAGVRPVLIVQVDPLTAFLRTVIVIPFTTNLRWASLPFCVLVSAGEGGLTSDSVALCYQIRVIDKTRLLHRLGQISASMMAKVEQAMRVAMGL